MLGRTAMASAGTRVALIILAALIIEAIIYFQQHQVKLLKVHLGGHRADFSQFEKLGINCEETYTVEGYETSETIVKSYGLTWERFFHLNPGRGAMLNRGDLLCVAGNWEPIKHAMAWFWPGVVGVVALSAAAAQLIAARRSARHAAPVQQPTEGKDNA